MADCVSFRFPEWPVAAEVWRHIRQHLHARPFDSKPFEGLCGRGALDAKTALLHQPLAHLRAEIGQITELPQRQEVAFD